MEKVQQENLLVKPWLSEMAVSLLIVILVAGGRVGWIADGGERYRLDWQRWKC